MSVEAYAAGIFDGEGCVLWYVKHIGVNCGVEVANCDRRVLDWLQSNFGGNVRSTAKNRKHRIGVWSLKSPKADDFLRAIRPYSILKAEQIDLFLAGRQLCFSHGYSRGGPRITEDELSLRREVADSIKQLKRPVWEELADVC